MIKVPMTPELAKKLGVKKKGNAPGRTVVGRLTPAGFIAQSSSNQFVVPRERAMPVRPSTPSGPIYPPTASARSAMGQARPDAATPIAPGAGAAPSEGEEYELIPGVTVRVKPGVKVGIQSVGTPDTPIFLVTPGTAVGVKGQDASGAVELAYSGIIPLLALVAKPVGKAIKKALAKQAGTSTSTATSAPAEPAKPGLFDLLTPHDDEEEDEPKPGETVHINGTAYTYQGIDQLGAILVDTDGRRTYV